MKVDINPTFHMKVDKTNLEIKAPEMNWHVYPKLFKVGQFPLQLDIELNNTCNIRCKKCFQSWEYIEPRRIQMDLVKKLIREGSYKGLESIKLQHRGEPLLYYGIEEIIRYAKQYEIGNVMFNTNATLLTREKIENIVNAGLDLMICSVDSYVKEVYEELHRGGKFDGVVKNIQNLRTYIDMHNLTKPIIRVQQVIQPENMGENEKFVEFWSVFADQVSQTEYLDYSDREDSNIVMEDWACSSLWQRLIIHVDGTVRPCCSLTAEEIGNVHQNTIEEIWNNENMKQMRKLHQAGDSHSIHMCSKCSMRKHEFKKRKVMEIG